MSKIRFVTTCNSLPKLNVQKINIGEVLVSRNQFDAISMCGCCNPYIIFRDWVAFRL